MKISIVNNEAADKFSLIITNLHRFCDNIILHFKPDQFYIQGMDSSQVCLFELKLKEDWFDSFKTDKSYVLGIHSLTFYKVIQCLEDNEQVMKMNFNDGDYLNIALENKNGEIYIINNDDFNRISEIILKSNSNNLGSKT